MELSNLSPKSIRKIHCYLRKEWVVATPEEEIRQALLKRMVEELGYPRELIVIEKSLQQLPHLATCETSIPLRRLDLLCFSRKEGVLAPLLLVECKATPLSAAALQQVAGYNHYVKAPFIAVVNRYEVRCGECIEGGYRFMAWLPKYTQTT